MLLDIRAVSKSFTTTATAVSRLSLTIQEGEIICLLGPSGCGKTTLLRLIAGLERPDEGEVWFNGRHIDPVPPHQRGFGLMFQDYALFPHKNVFDNIAFGLQMRGDSRQAIGQRVAEMLALVVLEGFGQRNVGQLSGGEQQRVALARSLAPGPRLLMLDEPLGALDRALRERLMVDLRRILQAVGVTAVYVTHDQTEAFAVADRIVVMNAGQIEQVAAPQVVFSHPQTPFVARFLGFENLIAGRVVAQGVVATAVGPLSVATDDKQLGTAVTLLIKPDALLESGVERTMGVVTAVSFRGRYYQVWVRPAGSSAVLMFERPLANTLAPGQTIPLAFDPQKILLYP